MLALDDPNALADAARGVNPEVIAETGHNIRSDTELDPTLSEETIGEELARLEGALSDAYIESSVMTKPIDDGLTSEQEARLERLLETRNMTEALRFMGLSPPEHGG